MNDRNLINFISLEPTNDILFPFEMQISFPQETSVTAHEKRRKKKVTSRLRTALHTIEINKQNDHEICVLRFVVIQLLTKQITNSV